MNSDDIPSDDSTSDQIQGDHVQGDQVHQGYDLESGMLVRAHEWIDLFPWLRLLRVLRVAGSPSLLVLTAGVFALWIAGEQLIIGPLESTQATQSITENPDSIMGNSKWFSPDRLLLWTESAWRRIAMIVWSVLIWSPLAMLLVRQGGLLTAGRTLMPLGPELSLATKRTPAAWLAAIVPFLCLIPFALPALLAGWVATWLPNFQPLQIFIGVIVALIALPSGLLAFGAHVAIPISWAALMNEQDADPLDSLSRGYEYLFRRPLQLVFYLLVSAIFLTIIGALAIAVAISASAFASITLSFVGAPKESMETAVSILDCFPAVVVLTLFWSLLGGIYLLLRYDAGNQEVEDLWQAPLVERPSLPELPK